MGQKNPTMKVDSYGASPPIKMVKRHGPDEFFDIYSKLKWQGSYDMGKECGEWFDDGETKTYPPCPDFE